MSPRKALYRVIRQLKARLAPPSGGEHFVAAPENRSISDNGKYVAVVEAAVRETGAFNTFKRHPDYQMILEHATREHGAEYLDEIARLAPDFVGGIDRFKVNDQVGGARLHAYPAVGEISPSTLRYVKIAAEIRALFGTAPIGRIAEIGIGYGGQLLVLDRALSIREYHIFDLPPVLALAARYLESHILDCAYVPWTINRHSGGIDYDLAMSNYAFSELPAQLQRKYVEKVLSRAKRGYLTMNSGRPDSAFIEGHLSIGELRGLLPPFEILEEKPVTAANNYVIVWGQTA